MDCGRAGDLPGSLVHPVAHVDPSTQVRDPHEDQEERDQGERELDECLSAAMVVVGAQDPHGFTVIWTAPVVPGPAALLTTRVM